MKRIALIGAGASGLMAAYAAAKHGCEVTIYEHGTEPGKKLLMTGNGKCNLTSMDVCASAYHTTSDPSRVIATCLEKISPEKLRSIFEDMRLLTRVYPSGLVYPYAEQARSVLDTLLGELARYKVKIQYQRDIYRDLQVNEGAIHIGNDTYDDVIFCCGGKSYKKTGSDGSGLEIVKKLGAKLVPLTPALVKLYTDLPSFAQLGGIRHKAIVTYETQSELGEVQFTKDGISGIAVFQISGAVYDALQNGNVANVKLNLFPEFSGEDLIRFLQKACAKQTVNAQDDPSFLCGALHRSLATYIVQQLHCTLSIPEFAELLQAYPIPIVRTDSLENAQVTRGGVSLTCVDTYFRFKKNVYICGEMLDVDGPCGGYNLHFAFASGYIAGEHAATC